MEKLSIGTADRPLERLINSGGKVLDFNYTEFIETLYGVHDICYIHGCRKNKKQKLILCHSPGAEGCFHEKEREARSYRQAVIDVAQDNVFELIGECDEDITKYSQRIIAEHRQFFDSLKDIDQIIVIGHSMSPVDWDYFIEINRIIPDVEWFFGCHGLNDLNNLEALTKELGIENYHIFRTDRIWTKPNKVEVVAEKKKPKERIFENEAAIVKIRDTYNLIIDDGYEVILSDSVKKIAFIDHHILIQVNDLVGTLLLFNKNDGQWSFIGQLQSFQYQSLVNRRLSHIYYSDDEITFVYNNRVKRYDLRTGEMICNQAVRNAKDREYTGTDVLSRFYK